MRRPRLAARRALPDAVALLWLCAAAAAFLAPALSHGHALGPYDLQGIIGITAHAHAHVHNAVDSDEIQEFIPWQALSWLDVRSGHLPLWDPYNLLGMPLAFNFESAPFSLTIALGYLFPLGLAHTATIVARLLLGGSGAYVLCRTLRLGVLPSAAGATIFELSGAFTIWLGPYEAGVYCFLGWALAASVLILRGRRRAVPVALLALSLALAFAAGEPQIDVLFVAFVAVFAIVVVLARRWGRVPHPRGPEGHGARRLLDHLLALAAAGGLVAPLYLPAGQLLLGSARTSGPYVTALPPIDLTHLLFASYSGVPTNLGSIIGIDNSYAAMVYVGAVALVLAVTGLAWLRRRPEVAAMGILVVLLGALLFAPPVVAVMRHLPELKVFRVVLATPLLDFALAILAAFGAQALLHPRRRAVEPTGGRPVPTAGAPEVGRRATGLFVVGTIAVALVLAALGAKLAAGTGQLDATQLAVRDASFLWPSIGVGTCALFALARTTAARRRLGRAGRDDPGNGPAHRAAADAAGSRAWPARARAAVAGRVGVGALVAVETAFCVIGGAWFVSSTANPLAQTPAIAALQHIAGTHLVGMGTCQENAFANLGIMPNVNAPYGVDELIAYDPILPTTYYSSFGALVGVPKKPLVPHVFCPAVTSVRVARFYGVRYVLEPPGKAGPPGTTQVAVVHGEELYSVPDSGRATLAPLGKAAHGDAATSRAAVEPTHVARDGTLHVEVNATHRALLVLRVTSAPGWQATIDGRPLVLERYDKVMLATVVPRGRHAVVLHYRPRALTIGLVISGVAAAALLAALAWSVRSRRRDTTRPPSRAQPEPLDGTGPTGPASSGRGLPGSPAPLSRWTR